MADPTLQGATRGLISAMLLEPDSIPAIESVVGAADFSDGVAEHSAVGDLFEFLCELHRAGHGLRDKHFVLGQLRETGLLDRLGGAAQFRRDFLNARASENTNHYAGVIRRCAIRRQTQAIAKQFLERAPVDDPAELAVWLRAELAAIESRASERNHASTLSEACQTLMSEIEATRVSGHSQGLETGLEPFDRLYGGLHPSRLYIVAARPGGGKSSLVQQVGESIAAAGHPTLLVSLEMSRSELAARYLARRTGVNGKYIASHCVSHDEWAKLQTAVMAAKDVPLILSEPFGRRSTVESICAEARVRHATDGIRLVLVDYLQISEPSNPKQSEYEKVTLATRAFKQLSRELRIPVVLLSQLSRKGDEAGAAPRRPRLSDLRSSGSIEQDADAVLFLHDEGSGNVRLIVAKMRGGERSESLLNFDGPTCTFTEPKGEQF